MNVRSRALRAILCCAAAGLLVAGCGGGGGGHDPIEPTGTALAIGADAAFSEARASSRVGQELGAPLQSGARVAIYDFATRQEIASGQTGPDGFWRSNLTAGLTAVVVITGSNAGKTYRLSAIIPVVPIGGGRYIADPATSLAAEAIAQEHFGRTALDQQTLDGVFDEACACIRANAGADWSLAGGLIRGTEFGAPGSLDADRLAELIAAVPDTINSNMVSARNCVRQIRDAGVPLASMLAQERPDIEGIFTEQVAARYEDLITRLHALVLPAMFGGMEYHDAEGDPIWPTVFDLEMGKGYKAELQEAGPDDSWLVLSDDSASNTPGQITITYQTAAGTYRLIARNSAFAWTVTQTFSGDASQLYSISIPGPADEYGANPSMQVLISLKDSQFKTPLTFQGMLSAVGPDRGSYTRIAFDGKLSSPEVSAQGKLQADFPSAVPDGADADNYDIYDFPIGFSASNCRIEAGSIVLSGNVSVLLEAFASSGRPALVPEHVEMTGAYSNGHTGLGFNGSITGDCANPRESDTSKLTGSLHLHGEMTRKSYPGYYADISYSAEAGASTAAIDLRAGNGSLTGTASGGPGGRSLSLVNQSGVRIAISSDASDRISGSMTVAGETVATVSRVGHALRITYRTTPSTFDEFPVF